MNCEYCKLLTGVYNRARGYREMRRAKARIRLHLKTHGKMLPNMPMDKKVKALKLATRLAYRIFKHANQFGYAIPLPKRTPALVRKYVKMILDANHIKWVEKNPMHCPLCGRISEKGKTLCRNCRIGHALLKKDKAWIRKNKKVWARTRRIISKGPVIR